MSEHDEAEMALERYLSRMRTALHGLPSEQVTDILRELRSHVQERAGSASTQAAVQAALDALGDPEQLAGQYVTQDLFDRAAVSRSPLLMMESLFHWATLSLQGFAVALTSLFLYTLGAVCLTMAIAFSLQGLFGGAIYGQNPSYLSERFPTEVRATAAGFCYHQGAIWGGLVAPVLTYLAVNYNVGFGGAMMVGTTIGLVSFIIALLLGPETKGKVIVSDIEVFAHEVSP